MKRRKHKRTLYEKFELQRVIMFGMAIVVLFICLTLLIIGLQFDYDKPTTTIKDKNDVTLAEPIVVGAKVDVELEPIVVEEIVSDLVAESNDEECCCDILELAYPDEDLELFAKILYLEAGSQSQECVEMVGNTILNRIESDFWIFKSQHTIEDVVSAKGQYTTYEKALRMDIDDVPLWVEQIADYLLAYGSQDTTPLWQHQGRCVNANCVEHYITIDGEHFGKLKGK